MLNDLPALGIEVRWGDRYEYVDDDRAGDDFIGRTELKKCGTASSREASCSVAISRVLVAMRWR